MGVEAAAVVPRDFLERWEKFTDIRSAKIEKTEESEGKSKGESERRSLYLLAHKKHHLISDLSANCFALYIFMAVALLIANIHTVQMKLLSLNAE